MTEEQAGNLDVRRLRLFRNDSGNLCLRVEGRGEWEKVVVRRAFPYTDPDRYVAFYAEEEEIGVLKDPEALDADSRAVLDESLQRRYHIPVILRISAIDEVQNATRWHVETDRGARTFEVHSRRSFRRIPGGGMIIVDVDANRFRIPDRAALDPASRDLLEMQI